VHINGRVKKGGIDTTLDGDLYKVGPPTVIDNEIRRPRSRAHDSRPRASSSSSRRRSKLRQHP
jgi:hypothetical protein